ncbi:MAG: DUF1338 domain-containing protein [Proteobacteria bacterium]|nr:MAG: DUF1338 domain-containing protein [Pseudomonadota bacterium]
MDLINQSRRDVFGKLWTHYFSLVPFAQKLVDDFKKRGDEWIEDHVAYRTLPGEHTGAHILQAVFETLGYKRMDDYNFEEKQLKAFWMCPPDIDAHSREASPKIFISELIPTKFSPEFQEIIRRHTSQVTTSPLPLLKELRDKLKKGDKEAAAQFVAETSALLSTLPAWSRPSLKDYEVLRKESEYAGWTILFGNQINHFTVSVHLMKTFKDIHPLVQFLDKDLQVPMNKAGGGIVKGTPELLLEQISTMAAAVPYNFQDGQLSVPYGFVEFAYRYPQAGKAHDGAWHSYYQGFVTSNADKIFESTTRS